MRLNPDNIFFRFLSLVSDLLMLNVLFLFTSVPIVTIGPALTAMCHVTMEMVRKQDPSIAKEYFKAFSKHFKQSMLLWLPLLGLLIFFISDLYVILEVIDSSYRLLQIPVWIFLFAIFSVMIYAFPMISTYPNKTKIIVKNALLISLANIPTTIFCLVLPVGIAKIAVSNSTAFVFVFSIFLFWGFGILAHIYTIFISRIFLKIEEAEQENGGSSGRMPVDVSLGDDGEEDEDTSDSGDDDETEADSESDSEENDEDTDDNVSDNEEDDEDTGDSVSEENDENSEGEDDSEDEDNSEDDDNSEDEDGDGDTK